MSNCLYNNPSTSHSPSFPDYKRHGVSLRLEFRTRQYPKVPLRRSKRLLFRPWSWPEVDGRISRRPVELTVAIAHQQHSMVNEPRAAEGPERVSDPMAIELRRKQSRERVSLKK